MPHLSIESETCNFLNVAHQTDALLTLFSWLILLLTAISNEQVLRFKRDWKDLCRMFIKPLWFTLVGIFFVAYSTQRWETASGSQISAPSYSKISCPDYFNRILSLKTKSQIMFSLEKWLTIFFSICLNGQIQKCLVLVTLKKTSADNFSLLHKYSVPIFSFIRRCEHT